MQAQGFQVEGEAGDAQGGHEFLIWEDRGAGPVEAFEEESDEEHPGPAEALLGDRDAERADTSSDEDTESSDEDERDTAEKESKESDEGDMNEGTGAPERHELVASTAGDEAHLWEDRQGNHGAQQVCSGASSLLLSAAYLAAYQLSIVLSLEPGAWDRPEVAISRCYCPYRVPRNPQQRDGRFGRMRMTRRFK